MTQKENKGTLSKKDSKNIINHIVILLHKMYKLVEIYQNKKKSRELALTNNLKNYIMLAETNKKEKEMLSNSLEEYLKTIYILKNNNEKIQVTKIANKMQLSKPSVNRALKSLKSEELREYEAYGEINLTLKGEELAKKILEAYDIVYVFLTEILEIPKEDAQEEAIKVKSVLNDKTLNSLTKYVHKILGIYELNCDYDINKEKCRNCNRKVLKTKQGGK